MSRYNIIIDRRLKDERAKKENCRTFDNVRDMVVYMSGINDMWVPIHYGSLVMVYREFGGAKSVRISVDDYNLTKCFLSIALRVQFDSAVVITLMT